jgi:hypothetical protein
MRRRAPLVAMLVLLLLIGAAAWYQFAGQQAPAGQPPLTAIGVAHLDSVRDEFNGGSDEIRVVLLLSPT